MYAAAAKSLQLCPTLCDPSPWNSPGQNTGVGSLSSGDLPNQGSNLGLFSLLLWQAGSLPLLLLLLLSHFSRV